MAGIRLGMAFASKEIIHYFNKVKPPYNVNQLTQKAALEALNATKIRTDWVFTILRERGALATQLAAFPFVQKV